MTALKPPCAGRTDLFFPEGDNRRHQIRAQINEAKALCATCPAQPQCREYGREIGDPFGIYGGETPRERRNAGVRLTFPVVETTRCGTDAGCQAHRRAGEPPCVRCREAHAAVERRRKQRVRDRARLSEPVEVELFGRFCGRPLSWRAPVRGVCAIEGDRCAA